MKVCEKCSTPLQDYEKGPLCDTCKFPFWFEQLPTELQTQVDSMIFAHDNILHAMKLMKDSLKIRLYDSVDLFSWRFDTLKESSREKFTCDLDTYWDGFYTL